MPDQPLLPFPNVDDGDAIDDDRFLSAEAAEELVQDAAKLLSSIPISRPVEVRIELTQQARSLLERAEMLLEIYAEELAQEEKGKK